MARRDISIHTDYPIINGFVQVPHNTEEDKNRVTVAEALIAITGSDRTYLSSGSGIATGWKAGQQSFLRLPARTPGSSYDTNPVDDLVDS